MEFPEDRGLPRLERLFDPGWVWEASRHQLDGDTPEPSLMRVRQFSHVPGRTATVNYEAEWPTETYLPAEFLTVTVRRKRPIEVSRFPVDAALPGLAPAADPDTALRLVDQHVFQMPRRRIAVETVRYRPGSRAVLRHRLGRFRFYVRVMRPAAVSSVLGAARLVNASDFAGPRVAGCWEDGGVVWLPEIPGVNMRDGLRQGNAPDPAVSLDGLDSLWSLPLSECPTAAFDLRGAYRRAERTFQHALGDDPEGRRLLDTARDALSPFVAGWAPTAVAHNDFYDDQMIVMPDGKVALVDFEEAGPGDPMLDVGNFLAHLSWASNKERQSGPDAASVYRQQFKEAALERFGWRERELALREAVCIFRICTNTVRRIKPDWRQRTRDGLTLAIDTFASASARSPQTAAPAKQ